MPFFLLGGSFVQSGSLCNILHMLAGITFAFEHVSILALRNLLLLPCGFTLYCKLVTRCCVSQLSWSACGFLICICKQKESSLLLTSLSTCSYRKSSVESLPTFNWYAFGFLDPSLYVFACFFLKHRWPKCPILLQCLHWCLLSGHLKPSMWGVSPHLWHLSSWLLCSSLNFSFFCGNLSVCLSSCWYLRLFDLGLNFLCFLWYLLGSSSSVHWFLSKFTCVACGSFGTCLMYFAVDLDDSSFFDNCLTLLAGNLSRSMLESFIVLETNSSS